MSQTYDVVQEMNQQFVAEMTQILAEFAIETDPKVKFQLMSKLGDYANSFTDYYDYYDPEYVA